MKYIYYSKTNGVQYDIFKRSIPFVRLTEKIYIIG